MVQNFTLFFILWIEKIKLFIFLNYLISLQLDAQFKTLDIIYSIFNFKKIPSKWIFWSITFNDSFIPIEIVKEGPVKFSFNFYFSLKFQYLYVYMYHVNNLKVKI